MTEGAVFCGLPMHIRPLVCRLYPCDYDATGLHNEFVAGCPIYLLAPAQTLGQCLGLSMPDMVRWHQALYEELPAETIDAEVTA